MTIQQVERFIKKIAQKFPAQPSNEENAVLTDIHASVSQVAKILRDTLRKNSEIVDNLGILKPYSFVLEDDDKENLGELYLADDDTIILGGDLMENLDHDLNEFLDDLLKE